MDTTKQTYLRNCPKCNIELTYDWKQSYVRACKNNQTCYKCRKLHWVGKKHSKETKCKMSKSSKRVKTNLGKTFTKEHRQKISQANMGNKSRTGLPHTEETKQKMSLSQKNRLISIEHRKKISDSRKGYKVPDSVQQKINSRLLRGEHHPNKKPENREKLRQAYLKKLETYNGKLSPFYNPSASKLFNEINQEMGWNGLHAENGGEVKIRSWFLDYYEPTQNIAIEYDESYHNRPSRKEKDIIKQTEIIAELGCKFYRIKQGEEMLWRSIIK